MDPQKQQKPKPLTVRFIDSIKPPILPVRRIDYPDGTVEGLKLRVTFRGVLSWTLRYRFANRKPRLKLGRYPRISLERARTRARLALAKVDQGRDPAAELKTKKADAQRQKAAARTFSDFKPEYMAVAKRQKRSWREDERRIDNKLLPVWGDIPVNAINRGMIATLLHAVATETPVEANRLKSLVTRMFNVAVDLAWIDSHPATRMQKPGGDEPARERVLSEHEIRVCWDHVLAAEEEYWRRAARHGKRLDTAKTPSLHPHFAAWVRLRLFTLQRGGEIIEMRWPDIDLDTAWWTIPAKYTKNKLVHRVPLSDYAVAELRGLRGGVPRHACVFPNDHLTGSRKHRLKRVDFPAVTGIGDIMPRDLRRTGSTNLGRLEVPETHIDKLLNHQEGGPRVRKVYNQYTYDTEKRAAMQVWTAELRRVLGDRLAGSPVRWECRPLEAA